MIGDERSFINGCGDSQLTLDRDVINDILQEESDYVYLDNQMLNHVERETTEMGLATMALKSVFLPRDLVVDGIFQWVIQE